MCSIQCGDPPACEPGSFSPDGKNGGGDKGCSYCTASPGYYCPSGSTSSSGVTCPVGFSCAGGAEDKVSCPEGWNTITTGSSECLPPCNAGHSFLNGSCVPCPVGTFRPPTNLDCMPCPPGSYSGTNASVSCTPCPAGSFLTEEGSNTSKACVLCPAGLYSSSNSSICSPCPASTSTEQAGATVLADCKCKAGFHGPNAGPCNPCDEGYYTDSLGAGECVACNLGNFSFIGSASCFSLEIVVAGEWEIVATSAGSGASQSVELTVGISRSAGMEQKESWASGVAHTVRQTFGHLYTQKSSTSRTHETGGSAGFSFFGFSFGGSATRTTNYYVEDTSAVLKTEDSAIANQISQEHADTVMQAVEENTETTITQSFGTDAASGAGVVWQFEYKIAHLFGTNVIGSQNIVLTDNVEHKPCCLPGTFADHRKPHGACLPLYPCACSASVCAGEEDDGSAGQQTENTNGGSQVNTVNIDQIVVHVDMKDLQAETNAKLAKMSKSLSVISKNLTEIKTEIKQWVCGKGSNDVSSLDPNPNWDHTSSPTWTPSPGSIPSWNQAQYKHCQPVFNSWSDLRQQYKSGSLQARTGGLGNLLIVNEYESWVCVFDDICSLGGDYYFCYVFQETGEKFVPWDQHFKLNLFQPRRQV